MGFTRVYPYIKPWLMALYLYHWKTKPVIQSTNLIGVTMTKSEIREVSLSIKYTAAGLGPDYLARALSGLYRAARSTKSRNEIMAIALSYGVVSNPEFIV